MADGRSWSFELDHDPCEARPDDDLALESLLMEQRLESIRRAEAFRKEHGPVGLGEVRASDMERLRALGYVE